VKYCDWICVVEVVEFVGWDMSIDLNMGKMNSDTIDSFRDSITKEKNSETTKRTDNGKNTDSFNSNSATNSSSRSNSKSDDDFEASVGMSRKWNAREAGREVAENTLKKLNHKPSFFLLFSTIHYEKHGGFQKFLDGVNEVIPEGTPIVGGTVAGFMNNSGCFTRGASGLAVFSPDLEISAGIGYNTKKNPNGAVNSVKKNISKTKKNHKAMIEILSTAVIPKLPGVGQKNVILSKKIGDSFVKLLPAMKRLNYGYDRSDEILELLSKSFPDQKIIGGCTMDDNKFLNNYQFYNQEVKTNSLVGLHISTDYELNVKSIIGYDVVKDVSFSIDDISKDRHVVKKMDGRSARSALFEKLNLNIEERDAAFLLYKNVYYYPLGFLKDNIWHACMVGLIYGENLIFGNQIQDDKLTLLQVSTEQTIRKLNEMIDEIENKQSRFIFGIACETFLETLGKNIFKVQETLAKTDIPFLIPFVAGESIYTPKIGAHHLYETINLLTLN